jgi:hypothetical protein
MPTRATLTTTTPVASSDESNGYATFAPTTAVSLINHAETTVMRHLDTILMRRAEPSVPSE